MSETNLLKQGCQSIVLPSKDRLSWYEYFMGLAVLVSLRSPDKNTRVGSLIIDINNRIIATGYNSTPKGIDPKLINWARDNTDPLKNKYPFVLHSEVSAILSAKGDLKGTTLYTTLMPCCECAKIITQSEIKKVIYLEDKYPNISSTTAAKMIFKLAGVKVVQFKPTRDNIEIRFQ